MDVAKWSSVSGDPLSEAAIRARHTPNGHFRFSPKSYEPTANFLGTARERSIYVFSGACRITVESTGQIVELGAAEFATLPEGGYHFCVTSSDPVRLLTVFPLPEGFRSE